MMYLLGFVWERNEQILKGWDLVECLHVFCSLSEADMIMHHAAHGPKIQEGLWTFLWTWETANPLVIMYKKAVGEVVIWLYSFKYIYIRIIFQFIYLYTLCFRFLDFFWSIWNNLDCQVFLKSNLGGQRFVGTGCWCCTALASATSFTGCHGVRYSDM